MLTINCAIYIYKQFNVDSECIYIIRILIFLGGIVGGTFFQE